MKAAFLGRAVGVCLGFTIVVLIVLTRPAFGQSRIPIPQPGYSVRFVDSQDVAAGNLAANAFDGNPGTIWHTEWYLSTASLPHELQIDLGASYPVNGLSYLPRQDLTNGRIGQYEVYVSADAVNWGQAVSSGTFPNSSNRVDLQFTAKTGRYLRLRALSEVNGNPWTSIAELTVMSSASGGTTPPPPSGDILPRTGWTVRYVDSQETQGQDGQASNVFDGNPNSMWHTGWLAGSAPLPHEIQINLGATYAVNGFVYLPRQDMENGRIAQYEFYVSTDGVNWGSPVATGFFANVPDPAQVTFTAKSGRYIRLRALSEVNGNPWTSVAELNVMTSTGSGSGGGTTNQPPNGTISSPATDMTIAPGQAVTFAGTATDPDNTTPLRYAWSFGTASSSTSLNPGPVTFSAAGVYTVTFTVTDAAGAADPTPATRTITVRDDSRAVIPRTGWTVRYVDSQETQGQDGQASNVFDGNPSSMWHTGWLAGSAPLPHEIQINLGATYAVSGFVYLPRQDMENGRIAQFEFYVSTDGVNWGSPVATGFFANVASEAQVTFTPKSGRYVRLRALSEVNGNPWTSVAELNVLGSGSGGTGGGTNQAPQVTWVNSGVGTYQAPANVSLRASASDPDGVVASVDFYSNSVRVASDSSAPYDLSLTNLGVGDYTIIAVATDNSGNTAASSPVTVHVVGGNLPTRAVFGPSPDHYTNVDRYVFDVFRAGANPNTDSPVASQDLGIPDVVSGQCNVDVANLIAGLESGVYFATVSAQNGAGIGRSAPSAAFVIP